MQIRRKVRIVTNILYMAMILMMLLCIMFLYTDYSAQIPFKLVFDVMLIQIVAFMIVARRVKISFDCTKGNIVYNDENAEIVFQLNKRSIYPFKKVEYVLKYKNRYDREYIRKKVRIDLCERKRQIHHLSLGKLSCGYYDFYIESVVLYDMFGFLSISLRKKAFLRGNRFSMIVLPAVADVLVEEEELYSLTQEEAEECFGEEVTETGLEKYDIREFANGDKLNRIHWKLSSKKDELMVREGRTEYDSMIYVFFDLCDDGNINDMFTKKVSLSAKILNMGHPLYIAWMEYNGRVGNLIQKRMLITSFDKLQNAIIELMACPLYGKEERRNIADIRFMKEVIE